MTDKKLSSVQTTRRDILKGAAAATVGAGALGSLSTSVWAAGSDAPEKTEVKVGFIPLTDCASVVVAAELGFDKKYGIKITPSKEASWAGVRDKLVNGELDASHVLYGLIYGLQLGTSGPQKEMAVLASINNNGQAITLSNQLKEVGVTSGELLKKAVAEKKRDYTFAQTFPTGTHAMWLYYWLAHYGINPFTDVKCIVVPPPQMVANMRVGNMDGYCVGEPWGARAIADDIGFTAVTTQEIWQEHPEKVLGTTADFVAKNPNTARALTAAILDAAKFIDDMKNRENVAKLIAGKSYVNTDAAVILGRFMGQYENGLGKKWTDEHAMKFYNEGKVSFPYLSDGMWFLTQHKRWGLLKDHPDYLAVAKKVNQIDIYKAAAAMTNTPVPSDVMRKSTLLDGKVWDGSDPKAYADSFAIKA
ncbi:MAG TPA: CmpA/NrtA family ABC transporter substrate-binding protein [Pseudomonadales bacterium]|nr:CmpA/NrtA family ABC transporter substrate-binding protein [Pseudomonadales bacterium]